MEKTAKALRALEEELFQPEIRKNKSRLSELLAEEFREFGSSGRVFNRAEIIEELYQESDRTISLTEFRAQVLRGDAVLVTYRALRVQTGAAEVRTLRSSIWVERDGRWQMVFHQGTLTSWGAPGLTDE